MKCICCVLLVLASLGAAPVKRIVDSNGDSVAVVVPEQLGVQFRPQTETANLTASLEQLTDVVKLNIVAANAEAASAARATIRKFYPQGERPAVSVVVGATRHQMPLELDAVEATHLPQRGALLFISGQAEKGETPNEAGEKTLAGLAQTLDWLGSSPAEVVQARCFLNAMPARGDVAKAAQRAGLVPMSFVQWTSDLPVEIELIANGPVADAGAPAIEYLTPPGTTASPLFARVVRVNRGQFIFVSDLYAATPGDGEAQVLSIFKQLAAVLQQTNSDMQHLAKATYLVSDNDASKQLNVLRPKFYDPARPPAASKAMVPAVGMLDRSISVDMIAVSTTQPAAPATP